MRQACSNAAVVALTSTVVGVTAACTTPTAGEAVRSTSSAAESGSPTTSTTVPYTLPAPHPAPDEHSDGTTFEPCTTFDANELRGWGVDPANVIDVSIELQNQIRGCRWLQTDRQWSLTIDVLNASVSKYRQPDSRLKLQEPITIGGLSGVMFSFDGRQEQCQIVLPSERAVVFFTVRIADQIRSDIHDACNKATDVATDVAPRLPQ